MGAQLGGSHFDNRTTLLLKRVPPAPAGFISWPAAVEDLQLSAFGPPQKPGLHHREHMSQKLWRAIDRRSTRRISKMTLPDGRQGYLVNCDNRGFDYCYTRSREICSGNFTVINRTDRPGEDEDERRIEMVCGT